MNFPEWFEQNKDELAKRLDSDPEEALFDAFIAGMNCMGEYSAKTLIMTPLDNEK